MPRSAVAGDDLVGGREADTRLAPGGKAGLHPLLDQPAGGVLHERDRDCAVAETSDQRVVADVRRNAEDDRPPTVRAREAAFPRWDS